MTMRDPNIDPRMLEETRRHINRLIEEVGRLSESELGPPEYYAEVLKRVLSAMAAPAGAVWTRNPQGHLQLAFQVNIREIGLDKDEEARKVHDELLRHSLQNPQPLHLLPNSGVGASQPDQVGAGNPTRFLLLLVPIMLHNEVTGFLEVWQSPERPLNAVPGFLQFMGTIAELMARYARNQLMGQMSSQQQVWLQLEQFSLKLHSKLHPTEVAYDVANEGRRLIDCDRVSVGVRYGSKTKIEAISGSDIIEKRSNLVKLMRKLFDAVLAWGEKLVYTGTKDDSLPPDVLKALDAYLAESNSKLLVLQPLRDEREKESNKPSRSGILMEAFDTGEDHQQQIARLDVISKHSAAALYNAVEYRRIPMRWIWMPIAKVQDGLGGKAKAILLCIFLALVTLVSVLILVPYPLKMDARGQLLPITRRWVYSREQGEIIQFINLKPNATFPENENLLLLSNTDIRSRQVPLETEIAHLNLQIDDIQRRLSGAQKGDASLELQLRDVIGTRNKSMASYQVLFSGLKPVPGQPGYFLVTAPQFTQEEDVRRDRYRRMKNLDRTARANWLLLNSDFRETLQGKRVDPSMPLLRLGDPDSGWEVELKLPQKHMYQIKSAYKRLNTDRLEVDLKVRTEPTRTFKGMLFKNRIGGEATPQRDESNEPEPVVLAYVSLDHPAIPEEDRVPTELRTTSGIEVLAKVRCGDAAMGYSLFYGVWEFICEKVLFAF